MYCCLGRLKISGKEAKNGQFKKKNFATTTFLVCICLEARFGIELEEKEDKEREREREMV